MDLVPEAGPRGQPDLHEEEDMVGTLLLLRSSSVPAISPVLMQSLAAFSRVEVWLEQDWMRREGREKDLQWDWAEVVGVHAGKADTATAVFAEF